jgi:PAS domain S-box-containing protein
VTKKRVKANELKDKTILFKELGVACVATGVALACRFALNPFLGEYHPYVTFFVAVAFTSWYGSWAGALTATLLGGLASLWFFIPPRLSLEVSELSQQVGLLTYTTVSLTFVVFGQVMHRARRRAEQLAGDLRAVEERSRRAERATAHLAAIVKSSDDAIISKNLSGIVMSWNQAAERLFGYRADEMIGRSITTVIPPDRHDEELLILEKISRAEMVENYETIRRRKDGTDFHVSLTISPLLDGQGRVIGASKIARDITHRVHHEQELAQHRERLRQALHYQEAVFSNIGEGLYTVNRQGLVVSVNRAAERLFGWTNEELVGRNMHDVAHYKRPDGKPFPAESCAGLDVMRSGVPVLNHDDVFIRKDGGFFDVVYSASPIWSDDEITGSVVVFRDVTAQKRAEEALRDRDRALTAANDELNQQKASLAEANKELQSFSYSVSHDLRAPLRTIDAYVRIVEEDHDHRLDDDMRRCLGIVKKAAGQAGELIDDLLEFSRLGRVGMDFRPTKMTELAREAVDELGLTHHGRPFDLNIRDLPLCYGDWRLLKLVWGNLLSNAFKFTRGRELTQIEIGWLPDDHQENTCVYYVKDNGVGFDMKYVHKLFGVFQRLHLKDEFEGTGVGLAIVQRIVQRHGGRIWAEGKIDGGATFYFSLRKAPNDKR